MKKKECVDLDINNNEKLEKEFNYKYIFYNSNKSIYIMKLYKSPQMIYNLWYNIIEN